tara:strand:- start:1192 stop:2211 length:1020 start_codon:yes stop_codon:yes gene_type:complete
MTLKQNKKVLVIRCGLLGDTVDATSVIDPLIEHFQNNVDIHWVTKPGISELFKYDNRIKKIFELKHTRLPFYLNIDKQKIIIDSIKSPYELILNLEIGNKFNDIVKFSRATKKCGMPYQFVNDDIFEEHRVDHQLRILELFIKNFRKESAKPSIVGINKKHLINKFNLNEKYIVLCPTNSHVGKKNYRGYRSWPANNWKDLMEKILKLTDMKIYLVGSKEEVEYFSVFHPLSDRVYDISGKTTIPELITILENSEVVVATDSGSVHLAGAVAKNIISIHGPTNSHQSSPYQTYKNNVRIATLDLDCSPCYDTKIIKTCKKNICMHNLEASKIFNLIQEF